MILVLNPIFSAQSTYTVFSHILQNLTSLQSGDHQLLVHWFRSLEPDRFGNIVRNLLQLITIRQFPPADKSLPPLNKSKWWIPTATKVGIGRKGGMQGRKKRRQDPASFPSFQ